MDNRSDKSKKKVNIFYIESNVSGGDQQFPETMPQDLRHSGALPMEVYISCIRCLNSSLKVDFKYVMLALLAMIVSCVTGIVLSIIHKSPRAENIILIVGGCIGGLLCLRWVLWMRADGCVKRVQKAATEECMPFCLAKGIFCSIDVSRGNSSLKLVSGEKPRKVLLLAIEICGEKEKSKASRSLSANAENDATSPNSSHVGRKMANKRRRVK